MSLSFLSWRPCPEKLRPFQRTLPERSARKSWSSASVSVLVAVSLGLTLAKTAHSRERREAFQKGVAPGVAALLLKLGPEHSQHLPDSSGRLAETVA
jgi:hypothetical protein